MLSALWNADKLSGLVNYFIFFHYFKVRGAVVSHTSNFRTVRDRTLNKTEGIWISCRNYSTFKAFKIIININFVAVGIFFIL